MRTCLETRASDGPYPRARWATLVLVAALTACSGGGNTDSSSTMNPPPPPAPGADSTVPTLVITAPGGALTVSTGSVAVSGTANDNVGVTQVNWQNDRGGSGSATGTGSWSASITLQSGANVISVTARDAANNVSAARSVTVTYDASAPADYTATVAWPPNADHPSGYSVYVSTTSGGAPSLVATLTPGGSWDTSAPAADISSSTLRPLLGTSTQACFTVKAFNAAGSSAASPVTCVTVP
jgi:hypothetical protein